MTFNDLALLISAIASLISAISHLIRTWKQSH